ncbi:hypothetical protein CR513_54482, partial [Mucuna pruriens]
MALYYPNKRSMTMKEDGIVDSASSKFESSSISESDASWRSIGGDMFNEFTSQMCSIIIDSCSSVNIASTELVEKLKLLTLAHPKPYKL